MLALSASNFAPSLSGTQIGHCSFPRDVPRNSFYSNSRVSKSIENRCGKFESNWITVISNYCGQEERDYMDTPRLVETGPN